LTKTKVRRIQRAIAISFGFALSCWFSWIAFTGTPMKPTLFDPYLAMAPGLTLTFLFFSGAGGPFIARSIVTILNAGAYAAVAYFLIRLFEAI
jgi:hypothetical protein